MDYNERVVSLIFTTMIGITKKKKNLLSETLVLQDGYYTSSYKVENEMISISALPLIYKLNKRKTRFTKFLASHIETLEIG
jgi:hypothetical protein